MREAREPPSGQIQVVEMHSAIQKIILRILFRLRVQKLLHHLDDAEVTGLLDVLASSATVQRVVTLDTVYLAGKPINNVVAFADRGRHTRTRDAYLALLDGSPFRMVEEDLSNTRTRNGFLYYFSMCLEPRSA